MSLELVGVFGFAVLLILMFLQVPVGVSMILVGLIGLVILVDAPRALFMTADAVNSSLNYDLTVLPVFLLMGEFADISGMMRDSYRSANTWIGNLPGGLAMASVLGAAAFSAVSGSSMACAAIMGRIALPQLVEHKYDPALATGALAAGGTLGQLIPPGIAIVIYAVIAEVSIAEVFIACVLPGALLVLMYILQIYIQCKLNPLLGPAAGSTTWKQKLYATKGIAAVATVFILVMGGTWLGVYTINEAASFGAIFVFAYALLRKTLNGQNLVQAFKSTLITSGMAFAIVIGANIFAPFTALSHIPQTLVKWLVGLNLSALGAIILIMVMYFILGICMNALTMILLTVPILLPVLNVYHIDLVWFGVLLITQCELANLSPPVGMNLFVIAAIGEPMGIKMSTVFRGSLPFCVTMLVFNALLIAFPQISLYLVSQMK